MFGEYLKQLGITARDSIITEDAVIELLIVLVIFFAPFAVKPNALPKNEQSIRKILIWKFRAKSQWRAAVILFLIIAYHFGFFTPYLVYKADKSLIKTYQQTNNEVQFEFSLATNRLFFSNSHKMVAQQIQDWADFAVMEYDSLSDNNYKMAARAFKMSFDLQCSPEAGLSTTSGYSDEQKSRNWPLYEASILKWELNEPPTNSTDRQIYNKFIGRISRYTNDVRAAMNNPNPKEFLGKPLQIIEAIKNLNNVEGIIPLNAPPDVTTTIKEVIKTLSTYTNQDNSNAP